MKHIVWLASYPKSGNTWFRVFLVNLLNPSPQPADINRLDGIPVASSRRLFDDNLALCSSDLTDGEVDRLRPELYRQLSADTDHLLYLKIHDACTIVDDRVPLVPPEATSCALYFIRSPLDVAVSFAHHSGEDVAEIINHMNDEHYCLCADPGRLDIQLRQKLGRWSGHVLGWVDAVGFDTHVIRYEDMLAQPLDTFRAALDFLGIEASAQQLKQALEFSHIDELKRQEQENGFNERHPACPSFFHQGSAGTWKDVLDDRQVQAIIRHHGPVMERFGYLDSQGQPL